MPKRIVTLRAQYFPMDLGDGYSVRAPEPSDEVLRFMQANFSKIFWGEIYNGHQRLLYAAEREQAVRELAVATGFSQLHKEELYFCCRDEPIGWFLGEAADMMTFYMRNTSLFVEHRHKGLYTRFLTRFLKYLADIGYERVSSQHRANNNAILIPKLRAGFVIGGMDLDERYGSLVRLMYFFHDDRRASFESQFGK